jgi:hypothetical protein
MDCLRHKNGGAAQGLAAVRKCFSGQEVDSGGGVERGSPSDGRWKSRGEDEGSRLCRATGGGEERGSPSDGGEDERRCLGRATGGRLAAAQRKAGRPTGDGIRRRGSQAV